MPKQKLIPKVKSLGELYHRSQTDGQYAKLLIATSENLGATDRMKTLDEHYENLRNNAMEGSNGEEGVVEEANFLRGLI